MISKLPILTLAFEDLCTKFVLGGATVPPTKNNNRLWGLPYPKYVQLNESISSNQKDATEQTKKRKKKRTIISELRVTRSNNTCLLKISSETIKRSQLRSRVRIWDLYLTFLILTLTAVALRKTRKAIIVPEVKWHIGLRANQSSR